AGQSQQARQVGGHHRRAIAEREHGVDRTRIDRLQHRVDGFPLLVIPHRDRAVAPRIVELIAAIGGVDELDAELLRGFGEHARLIPSRRRQEQYAFHSRATCSAVGSAQQYQGSFMYGMADLEGKTRSIRREVFPAPRARCASSRTVSNTASREFVRATPASVMTCRCSASTRGSRCVQGYVSVLASKGPITAAMSPSSSSLEAHVTSSRMLHCTGAT